MKVKVAQLYPTLCDPWTMVHRILQARILEWVAFPFSMGSSQSRDQTQLSHILYHSLPNPGIELGSPALQVDSLRTDLVTKQQVYEAFF